MNTVDRLAARNQSQNAFKAFKREQAQANYKQPEWRAPETPKAAQSSYGWQTYGKRYNGSIDAYYRDRSAYFDRNPVIHHYYTSPPVWVSNSSPSYGWLATAFLGGVLLDRITQPSYAAYAYSLENSPNAQTRADFAQWHEDITKQAQDNADLRAKMAVFDEQMAKLKAENASTTASLPTDLDPSVVVAPGTAAQATESSSHWLAWTIGIIVVLLAAGAAFLIVCLKISERRRMA